MLPRTQQRQTFVDFLQEAIKNQDSKFLYEGKIVLPRVALAFGLAPTNNIIRLEKQNFTNGKFSSVMSYDPLTNLSCHFVDCTFKETDLSQSDFTGSAFILSTLRQVNFTKSKLSNTLINVNNSSAIFDSADLSNSQHIASYPNTDTTWNNTSFRGANLANAVMNVNTSFTDNDPDAILNFCDFTLADLTNFTLLNLDVANSLFINVSTPGFRASNPTSTFGPKEIPSAWFFRCVFRGKFYNINFVDSVVFSECDFNHSNWVNGNFNALFDTGEYDHSLNPAYSTQNQTFFKATFDRMYGVKSGIMTNHYGQDLSYCTGDIYTYLEGRGATITNSTLGSCSHSNSTEIGVVTGFLLLLLALSCYASRRDCKKYSEAKSRLTNTIGTLYHSKKQTDTAMIPIPQETDPLLGAHP